MPLLEISSLSVTTDKTSILHNLSLTVDPGQVVVLMGQNGSGKSTLAHVIAGHPSYKILAGSISFKGKDILPLSVEERAIQGIFLAFQHPVEIPGLSNMTFLKSAINAIRKGNGEGEISTPVLIQNIQKKAEELNIPKDLLKRAVNVGFSGGEKKRNDMLQMSLLEPSLCILDEIDSGLDIDALKTISETVNRMRSPTRSFLLITHYQRLLDLISPDVVHILHQGKIIKSGDKELALQLEREGYKGILENLGEKCV